MISGPRQVLLSKLIPGVTADLVIRGVALDSRIIAPGHLFMAIPGIRSDGRDYIDDAFARGAVAVVCQAGAIQQDSGRNIFPLEDLPSKVGDIAGRFYDSPSEKMFAIGVTGTNGKTSCCHYLAQCMNHLGVKCGLIGTLGYGLEDEWRELERTTPDATIFQRCLSEILEMGAEAVCFEASSHGLAQGRLRGTSLDMAVFTNLSRDHLDYHEDLDDYFTSKRSLFQFPGLKNAIVNGDDDFGQRLITELNGQLDCVSYGIHNSGADIACSECEFTPQGTVARISTPWGHGILKSHLLGEFNLSNLLGVIAALGTQGYGLPDILRSVLSVRPIKGRMDLLRFEHRADVVVDYAHTPDALEKVLAALRTHCRGSLWCLFGCGGDRDRGKRKLMGEIAYARSDALVITSDNPRSEEPEQITADILEGVGEEKLVVVELDRGLAIQKALETIGDDDLLLVAGKGHEKYQEVMGIKIPYSDYEEIYRAMV